MNKYKKNLRVIVLVCAIIFSGCTDISDTWEEYRGDSETIYVGRIYPAIIRPGNLRVQFLGMTNYAANAKQLVIEWGDNKKTYEMANIMTHEMPDLINEENLCAVLIDDLAEGNYVFTFYTLDRDGNRSVKEDLDGIVFGDNYISAQAPRDIEKLEAMPNNTIEIIFGQVSSYMEVVLSYNDQEGTPQQIVVTPDISSIIIDDFELGGEMKISHQAKPSAFALDYVEIKVDTYTFPEYLSIDRSGFVNMALLSDAAQGHGGNVANLWDSNADVVMHTADNVGVPSHVTIDMGTAMQLVKGRVEMRSIFIWCPYRFQVWGLPELEEGQTIQDYEPSVSDNLANSDQWETESLALGWVNLTAENGTTGFATRESNSSSATFDLHGTQKVRYIRYRALKVFENEGDYNNKQDGSGAYFCTGELYLFEGK